ncbi:MAG: carboxypeptidase-like regulatory domain-containing protein [Flavobacteriales bacterium]
MKTKKHILIALLMGFGISAIGQGTGEIKGVIFDVEENKPIYSASATITYAGNIIGDVSDFDGKFHINSLQPGKYILEVSYLGRTTVKQEVLVTSGQISFRDTIFMEDTAGIMKAFTKIEYRDKLIDPYQVSKPTLRAEQLSKMAEMRNPANLLKVIGEGAFSVNEGTGEVYFRGSRSNGISTYLDGMKVLGAIPSLPAAAISRYSVYTGGLPAKYGDTMGGVIEIETKSYFDLYNQRMAQRRLAE